MTIENELTKIKNYWLSDPFKEFEYHEQREATNDIELLLNIIKGKQKEIVNLECDFNKYYLMCKDKNIVMIEALKDCIKAIRKNLTYAQYKDEAILYEAFQKATKALEGIRNE